METDHTENVVDRAVAYVKDFFGVPPGDRTPDVEAKPEYTDTAPEPTIEGAMRLEPPTRTLKIGPETERPREDESSNSAADRMNDDKKVPADSEMQKAIERSREANGTKDILSAAERHVILSRPGGSVGRMPPPEAGLTSDDAMGLDPY